MVREWGFSTEIGPIGYGPEGPSRDNPFAGRPYAEETQRAIDQEVATLLRDAEARATKLLRDNRATLDRVIELLLDRETIDGAELATITGDAQRPWSESWSCCTGRSKWRRPRRSGARPAPAKGSGSS